MVAVYPGSPDRGQGYSRHRDNSGQNGREVTAIVYANADWDPSVDGGALVCDEASLLRRTPRKPETRTVEPLGGRLVLFLSELEHEVRPAYARRAAVTLWLLKPPANEPPTGDPGAPRPRVGPGRGP